MSLLRHTTACAAGAGTRGITWLRRGLVIALLLVGTAAFTLHPQDFDYERERSGGRYQVTHVGRSDAWVILDTETGKFEHWVPVAGTSKYWVFGCKFGAGCSIFDKRSVDRGLDP